MKFALVSSRLIVNEFKESFFTIQKNIFIELINNQLTPIPISNIKQLDQIKQANLEYSLIILTGGESNGENIERDLIDQKLLEFSIMFNIPVLGICRGMQQMLIHFGYLPIKIDNHVAITHSIYGEISGEVNSYHNWGFAEVPKNFEILSQSHDDYIEAILEPKLNWLGIMWHPERMNENNWLSNFTERYF